MDAKKPLTSAATSKILCIGDYFDVLQTAKLTSDEKVNELKTLWKLWETRR
jgi:hypothetical protein